ncbi:MAG TPA: hypothetical protein VN947_03925 [Polyangia bacterium]|nr:hypothetical protein [Polyangia bacterium]
MGSRAALIAGVVVALAGCEAGGSNGVGGGDMGTAGGSDMAAGCAFVTVTAVDANGDPTENAPARLVATASGLGNGNAQWTLTHAGDPASYTPMPTNSTNLTVQYDATQAGLWTFTVQLFGCRATGSIELKNPTGVMQLIRLRALPPETSGFPLYEKTITITGGQSTGQDLVLDPGLSVSGTLRSGGTGIAGQVRLIADDGPDAVALAGANGSFTLAVQAGGDYTPLFIPSSTTIAPHLGAKAKGSSFVGASFDLPGGVAVNGSVVDTSAVAIAGANVVLRAGALPSGPGLTDGSGAFTLWAEAGAYTLSFGAGDWPQGSLDNVSVAAGASVAIAYTIGRVAVGGSVVADDGTTPVAGARVTITSHALAAVADVSIDGAAAVHAGGRVARVVTTDGNGALPAMQLPLGTYDIIVEPPGPSLDGLTAITEVLGGPATWTLALQKPVPLTVSVTNGAGIGIAGVTLTAIETVGLGAAPMGTTDANGHFTFTIDRGAPLTLVVEPPASTHLAGTRLSLSANAGSAAVVLPPGLPVVGVVSTPGHTTLSGVLVEALCYSCGSTTPIATSITDGSGTYHLYLPDPGDVTVDGGVP